MEPTLKDNLTSSTMIYLSLTFLTIYLVKKYAKRIKRRLFLPVEIRMGAEYRSAMRELKTSHFAPLKNLKSSDPEFRKQGALRILEIGAGAGANFEFLPANTSLIALEPWAEVKDMFYATAKKYSNVVVERFVINSADDMKDIASASVDAVVSTLVLCTVGDVRKTLEEIHRVLVPGGKFFFWEHVSDHQGTLLHFKQRLMNPIWNFLFDGCHLTRHIDQDISSFQGFSHVEQKRFRIKMNHGLWPFIKVHLSGVAYIGPSIGGGS